MQAVRNKMAALKAKLDEAEREARMAEDELNDTNKQADENEQRAEELNNELSKLEENLDVAETGLQKLQQAVSEAEKSAEEGIRARKVLENRGSNDSNKIERLEIEYNELTSQREANDAKYEEVTAVIGEHENVLVETEEELVSVYARTKDLDTECILLSNSLRSLEISEGNVHHKVEVDNSRLGDLKFQLAEIEEKAAQTEEKVQDTGLEVDELDEKLYNVIDHHKQVKAELTAALAELAEI